MIKWYSFSNFYSFREKTVIDLMLRANSSPSHFDIQLGEERVSKVIAILGPNGSGKSNLLKPLAFLRWFCDYSFNKMDNEDELPFYPHFSNQNEPTEFEVCFTDDQGKNPIEFKYYVKMTKDTVIHEELKWKSSRQYSTLFFRTYDLSTDVYKVKASKSVPKDVAFIESELSTVPKNASAISYFKRKDKSLAHVVLHNFKAIDNSNLTFHGKTNFSYGRVLNTTKYYKENEDIFKISLKYLKRMNFGLVDIELRDEDVLDKDTGEKTKITSPYGIHSYDHCKFEVPFYLESTGTQACYDIMSDLVCAFQWGGVAVIDELDSDLHPLMVNEIIDMFANEDINKKNAQLIFSCHSPEVLKALKKHNVYLVEKHEGVSECWRLDQVQGLRSQDNLYAKYITGAIGGVPDISL